MFRRCQEDLRRVHQIGDEIAERERLRPRKLIVGGERVEIGKLVGDMEELIVAVVEDRADFRPLLVIVLVPGFRLVLQQLLDRQPEIERRRAHLPQRRRRHRQRFRLLRPDREDKDLAAAHGGNVSRCIADGEHGSKAVAPAGLLQVREALRGALAGNVRAEQPACRRIREHDAALCNAADSVPAQPEQRRKRRTGDFHFFHISSFPFLRWIIARIIPQILRRGYYDFLFFAQFWRQTLFSIHIH